MENVCYMGRVDADVSPLRIYARRRRPAARGPVSSAQYHGEKLEPRGAGGASKIDPDVVLLIADLVADIGKIIADKCLHFKCFRDVI